MGTIRHDMAIGLSSSIEDDKLKKSIKKIRKKAVEAGIRKTIILGPHKGVNGYDTYVYCPDGSKEGWSASDASDGLREEFIELFDKKNITLVFGGDCSGIYVEYNDYGAKAVISNLEY